MKLYAMDLKGHKELIAWAADQSVSQPFLVKPRNLPVPNSTVDYSKKTGIFKVENIYVSGGPTLQGVQKGEIKKIRVCKIEYRHSSADVTPLSFSFGGGTVKPGDFDIRVSMVVFTPFRFTLVLAGKTVIGGSSVRDGSAAFEVPAMQPLYFQLINAREKYRLCVAGLL